MKNSTITPNRSEINPRKATIPYEVVFGSNPKHQKRADRRLSPQNPLRLKIPQRNIEERCYPRSGLRWEHHQSKRERGQEAIRESEHVRRVRFGGRQVQREPLRAGGVRRKRVRWGRVDRKQDWRSKGSRMYRLGRCVEKLWIGDRSRMAAMEIDG